ncbi:zinc ribbon domain-containing protein [Methanobacterium alcaliphilum]|uniref:zinc ribbon domain-containing protein n=1 Tax=Methanobacterium alcaliphilum TaxID=392018 RepID=UPI00200B3F6B|nr:zinc ribbon domain-containing protein [Methanobacterium alcaliphilum]MCK9150680.1 hypothetical protein [Methanobacterium alcaliphilum]
MHKKDPELMDYTLICPECGVGNPENAEFCLVCEKNFQDTLLFFQDDFFDLEITKDHLVEYRKNFWGTSRTGKVIKYLLSDMRELEFESKITRFKFNYNGKKHVLPIRKENMEQLIKILK